MHALVNVRQEVDLQPSQETRENVSYPTMLSEKRPAFKWNEKWFSYSFRENNALKRNSSACHFYRCRTLRMIDMLRHILTFNLQRKETRGNVSYPTSLSEKRQAFK